MKEREIIHVGDICKSIAGRDKDGLFICLCIDEKSAKIIDGKTRKIAKPKTKNIKHLVVVKKAEKNNLAERINKGEEISNKKIYSLVNQKNKEE